MKKIPTLFMRNLDDMRYVTRDVHPDCQWVIDGEGVATRKYDGTCLMYDGRQWWARREVKPGKNVPPNYVPVQHDANTDKTVGWEPIEQSAFARYFIEARDALAFHTFEPGTYELCGPKVNRNPEGYARHVLIRHAEAECLIGPRDYDRLAAWLADSDFEGIVWHHPDGRMAKLKRKDFPT